jgi:hypothetical protein
MRIPKGLLIGLALVAGCGASEAEQECPSGAGCADCRALPSSDGRTLIKLNRPPGRALPPVVGSSRVTWNCGLRPSRLDVRKGIPASVALFGPEAIYFSTDIPLQSSSNPLHRFVYGEGERRSRRECKRRIVEGVVGGVTYDGVVSVDVWRISVVASTRLRTSEVDGVPRLPTGMAVRVDALDCPGRVNLLARTVTATG